MAARVLHFKRDTKLAPLPPHPRLSPRLNEVLALLSMGCSNNEIAGVMSISSGTVRCYIKRIIHRLGIEADGQRARVLIVRVAAEDAQKRAA
jgi:DNA-binding NarL/FixJ family response regulator